MMMTEDVLVCKESLPKVSPPPEGFGMPPARPTLDLLRAMSDRLVITSLATDGPASRALLAGRTGLSKPTVGQSVSRLVDEGIVVEGAAARADGARGRAGTVVDFGHAAGCAVAIHAGPQGLVAQVVGPDGIVRERLESGPTAHDAPVSATALRRALGTLVRRIDELAPGPVRAVTVSIANPVDRDGRTVELPIAPYLTGRLDVPEALSGLGVRAIVDNDVHWAALAERSLGAGRGIDDVVHVHLAEGMGAAVISGGVLVRGAHGLAAEIAYAPAGVQREGQVSALFGAMESIGVVVSGSGRTIVDVGRVSAVLDRGGARAGAVVDAVRTVVLGACRLLDPAAVVLGGSWGRHPALVGGLRDALARESGLEVEVRERELDEAPLVGACQAAVSALRDSLVPTP